MGIDFVVDLPCPVKDELSTSGMVELIKARLRADMVLALARQEGDERDPGEITFTTLLKTPKGVEEQEVSVQQLLKASEPLEELQTHCGECPANASGGAFGCFGIINYPIASATEEWLMSLLPKQLKSTAGHFLQRAIADFGYDGAPLKEMRKDQTFFEAPQPTRRKWSDYELTGDQLLHMMCCVGDVQPAHGMMLALFLGVLPHGLDPQRLRDPAALRQGLDAIASLPDPPEDGEAFLGFLRCLVTAVSLECDLLVDY